MHIPCPCVCCTDGADVAGVGAVGCRTAECCRRHQTAAARVAALTQDPRDEDEADEEADALAGAVPHAQGNLRNGGRQKTVSPSATA